MDIQNYLASNNIHFTTHDHPPAYTAQEVACGEHVSGKMVAKTVIIRHDGYYAMCVLPADTMLDMRRTARAFGAKVIELADETEMADLFPDEEIGSEAPFGNLYDMQTVVDRRLAEDEEIMFQAGNHRRAIRMRYDDYAALAQPRLDDITTRP